MVLEPMALLNVADQVYKTVLCKEVRHLLDLRAPHLVKFHGQVPKDDCVLETFRAFPKSGMCLNVDGGKNALVTTSQLTTFFP